MGEQPAPAITIDHRSIEETFGLLGDEVRVDILRALADAREPLSFSELRTHVGVEDSGRFNYHLRKLVGTFVRHDEAGYDLTYAGSDLVGALYAGMYTVDARMAPLDLDDPCPLCGGRLVAEYADETARIECRDCEEWINETSFPPGSLDQFDASSLPVVFDRWLLSEMERLLAGFCTSCAGAVSTELEPIEEPAGPIPARLAITCGRCGSASQLSAVAAVFLHPVVRGLLAEHDIDLTPTWSLWSDLEADVRFLDRDPPRLSVAFRFDDVEVRAAVGADGSVRSLEVDR
ncbi:MAG: winged helix-turn-helix domain-containing protein [Halobacteriota archaeon]